jgi:hypothetical protein
MVLPKGVVTSTSLFDFLLKISILFLRLLLYLKHEPLGSASDEA